MRSATRGGLRTFAALAAGCSLAACAPESGPPAEIHGRDVRVVLDRPDTPGNGLQFRFDNDDVVETFPSPGGRFVVHFAREGDSAVPDDDEDASGVPDFVEEVAATYDEVLGVYEDLGFRAPLDDAGVDDNGGDDRFDVYLVDFGGVGDGTFRVDACEDGAPDRCAGFMTQENDFAGYGYPSTRVANRILASHELFHAVQAAYDRNQGSVLAEGSAVWATETFDPSLEDFEAFLPGFLENPDRPLDEPLPGPVDPFSYGSAIVFQFLTEAYGEAVVPALWASLEDGAGGVEDPQWMATIDGVLQAEAGVPFSEAYAEFARWNLHTDDFADPETAYADGADYPRVKIELESAPLRDDSFRMYYASASYIGMVPGSRVEMTAALVAPADDPTATDGLELLLGTETGDLVDSVRLDDPRAGTEVLDVAAADRFLVVVINTATSGDSKKPGLCIGDPDEVAACIEELSAGETSGSGGSGGATPSTTETASSTTAATTSTGSGTGGEDGGAGGDEGDGVSGGNDDGCGCRLVEASGRSHAWALFAVLALAIRRTRRRRARDA